MTNSIFISKAIFQLLANDEVLKESVTAIYPLIAENDAKFPFITFTRDNIFTSVCKDGLFEDKVTFSIMVVSANYIGSLEIANRVRAIFEKNKIYTTDVTLHSVRLTGVDESYNENSYIQNLSFDCVITN